MKRLICWFLCIILLLSVAVLPFTLAEETPPAGQYGKDYLFYADINADERINAKDALWVLRFAVKKAPFTVVQQQLGDLNGDHEIDAKDALLILQYAVEKIQSFSVGKYYVIAVPPMESQPESSQPQPPVESEPESSKPQPPVESEPESSQPQLPVESEPESSQPQPPVESEPESSQPPPPVESEPESSQPAPPVESEPESSEPTPPVESEPESSQPQPPVESEPESSEPTPPVESEPEEPPVSEENYITQYDKSNSVNGAYEKDTTADTSFVINSESLTPYTMYMVTRAVLEDCDNGRLVYSLQGLLNRDFGVDANHSTLIHSNWGEVDVGWIDEITKEGSILNPPTEENGEDGLTQVLLSDFDSFYQVFRDVIHSCGIILWDGNVPATANVAGTICGLDGYLPVLAQSPLHQMLAEDGVPVKQSLVGLFADGNKGQNIAGTSVVSTGSAKNDAYLWALEKYFARCSSEYLAYILDGSVCIKGYDAYEDHPTALLNTSTVNCLANHDYLIARRCFFFDLAPYKGEAACDDPAQQNGLADIGTDNATMLKIYQARYDRAGGEFGALLGFPPWWVKYTAFREMGSKAETWVEWLYCEYITCYNLAKEADAQSPAAMSNGSVYFKYVPKYSQYTNNKTKQSLTFDKNTYYYTIYLGDYDSSAWLRQHIYNMWVKNGGDTVRGSLPLMWGINPNLSYRVPMIFDYLYENKTANDYFVGGDGGAGYIIPAALFHDTTLSYMGEKRPSGNEAAGDAFASYTLPFYQRFDMDITGFLINGNNGNITKNIAKCVNQYSPVGNFANASSMGIYKYNGTYYVNCYTGIGTSGAYETMYNFASGGMSSRFNKKNFGAYRTVCHTPTQIAGNVDEFAQYASGKGMKVQYCDPYTYFDLLQQSGQGSTIR